MRPRQVTQLIAWYVALLMPTLYVKYRFMLMLSRWWVDGASTDALSDGEIDSFAALWFGHVAPADVVEVAAIVLVVGVAGHAALRIPLRWLSTVTVALAVVFLGCTLVSLRETGTLMTADALTTTWRWLLQDRRAVALSGRQWLLLVAGALWVAAPVAIAWLLDALQTWRPARVLSPSLVAGLVVAAAAARPDALSPGDAVHLSRGLWSAAIVTLARERVDRPTTAAASPRELQARYFDLVYPAGRPGAATALVDLPASARRPRHIVVVILETAPREFYPLVDNDTLPAFRAMSRHAVASDRHYTAAPRTDVAIYSLMSGTYARGGTPIYDFGRFKTDGLATVLGANGYATTYIDSITLTWNVREEALGVSDLGFQRVVEVTDVPLPEIADPFDAAVARERKSLSLAREAVVAAERQSRKALVAVATNLGHFPWRAPAGQSEANGAARLGMLTRALDGLLGELIAGLEADGLTGETIIAVVGDHGLRFSIEFESLERSIRHGELMFNVPMLIYAPALLDAPVRLPWPTSHVDVTPTLLDWVGISRDGLLLHGENMLDGRLAERVTLLPSGMFSPMYPVDGFHFGGNFFTWASALDLVRARPSGTSTGGPSLTAARVRDILSDGRSLFDETAAHFLSRATPP